MTWRRFISNQVNSTLKRIIIKNINIKPVTWINLVYKFFKPYLINKMCLVSLSDVKLIRIYIRISLSKRAVNSFTLFFCLRVLTLGFPRICFDLLFNFKLKLAKSNKYSLAAISVCVFPPFWVEPHLPIGRLDIFLE